MQLVVQSGSEPGRTYDITASQKIRMGRQSGNDVVVPDEQVSRRHAEIEERNGGLVVSDLGSSNGTFVNGTRITATQNLKPGDTVQVGTTVLKVVGSAAPAPAANDYDQGATQVGGYAPRDQDYGNYGNPPAPSTPSAPATDYGQSGGYGQSSSAYGSGSPVSGSGSSYDQGQNNYGGSSYGNSGSSAGTPSYEQGQNAYGGSSPAGGSSYGNSGSSYGGSSPAAGGSASANPYGSGSSGSSYDQPGQGQNAYGGSGQNSYGGSSSAGSSAGTPSYDQGQSAYGGSGSGQSSYGGSSSPAGGSASGSSYGGSSYDPSGQGAAGGYGQQNSYGQSGSAYGQSGASYDPANPGGSSAASASPYGGSSYDPANPSAGGYNAAGQQGQYGQPGQPAYNQGQNAYGGQQGQYGQPGQPGVYGQPVAPAAVVAKKRGLPLPLLIVGIVVVLVIVGALVFFLVINKGGGSVGDVPAPPNSTKLDVSVQDILKTSPDTKVSQADLSKVNFGIYSSTDNPTTISDYYKKEMVSRGWTQNTAKSTTTASVSELQFTKGDQSASISIVNIADDATATALGSALPALSGKVKAGQTLVTVGSGPTNIVNAT